MRINKAPLLLYFFFLLIILSRQETPTGQTILVFDDGIPADQFTDTAGDVVIEEEISAPIDAPLLEVVTEEVVADSVESIEIVDIVIPQEEQESVGEAVQESGDVIVEEIVVPLDEVIIEEQEAVPIEEVITVEEAITVEDFMTALPADTVVIIGENAPTRHLLSALRFASSFGIRVVKDSEVTDMTALHAISLGTSNFNSVSAFALEKGAVASDEGDYFIYENKETGTVILVVAGETLQETRKAVQNLLKY